MNGASPHSPVPTGQVAGPTLVTARWVVGHAGSRHHLLEHGEVVFHRDRIVFVGHDYQGEVARRVDFGQALIGPGFIDLDALADLDTTILGFDNQPSWEKGRIWPKTYMDRGPYEMYTPQELAFQKHYAFAQLIRNGITTALPIASLFYREWGETTEEFASAADSAEALGLRVYLGPAYRAGNTFIHDDGKIDFHFDEARGLANLDEAIAFCRRFEGMADGLVRTMLAPDRIETATAELLRRSAAAAADLDVPIRLHCCQSKLEYDTVERLHGMSPPEWLASIGFLSERALLPHGTYVTGSSRIERSGNDLEIIRDGGATVVHCPLVSARHGSTIESFARYRAMGLRIGMGTDTWPPDMVLNMQVGMMLCRVVDASTMTVRSEDYYDAATVGGADALRRPDLGRLMPGAKADIVVFDLGHDRIGQVIDPIQTMMLNGAGRDVSTVIIDGRFVMSDGVIPGFDPAEAQRRAQAQFDRLIGLYPERTWKHPPVGDIFSSSYPVTRPAS
ncbi:MULTISPECIES: amidohydrolase family protein [Phyllobacteriaceae]|uniref:N-ethylammeline chlorohydrolase n=2 Tax=root TaxID=1 RepID=A0A1C2DKD0_9HYPH|nr:MULTISPECIES: amidohydrolase family protein [Mesorhizobium]MBN9233245.1 amidohydrolase family protein [Mesorhizobium sp.]OCX15167.1 N-ethylammeline chlorohydrolase [Mesorhizobium hungaricum]